MIICVVIVLMHHKSIEAGNFSESVGGKECFAHLKLLREQEGACHLGK